MREVITAALSNFSVTCIIAGLVAAGISLGFGRRARKRGAAEELLAYFLLFAIGLDGIYNGVIHIFFGEMAARFIGWPDSPFQTEVGLANLAFGVLGILGFRGSLGIRAAGIIAISVFLLGAAGTHVWSMIQAGNYAPGNAGAIFYTDIAIPLIGALLLLLRYQREWQVTSIPAREP
jgi:hypothetical protein